LIEVKRAKLSDYQVTSFCENAGKEVLGIGTSDGTTTIFDVEKMKLKVTQQKHNLKVNEVYITEYGLISAGEDGLCGYMELNSSKHRNNVYKLVALAAVSLLFVVYYFWKIF